MRAFYAQLHADTPAMQEYVQRGAARSIVWSPARMVDAAEEMLAAYQRNANSPTEGKNSLLPIIVVGMAKDYTPTDGGFGGRQVGRQFVSLTDDCDASVYGYRQAMGDVRAQVVIFAHEEMTARSLAAQFCLWLGDVNNRRFKTAHQWGEYTVTMPVMLESPDTIFQSIDVGHKQLTVLAGDITFKVTIPYFDAPKAGQPNDGSNHNPKGYPRITEVSVKSMESMIENLLVDK